jgi:peptidoglycan/xylan/chitin deacetylase (PgdA/CDA1 family)
LLFGVPNFENIIDNSVQKTFEFSEKIKNKKIIFEYHQNIQKFTNHAKYPKDTQFVLLQFDGSYSLEMWKKTLAFSEKMKLQKKPVRFTYFISGVYFVPKALKNVYDLDGYRTGHSDIGWGDDIDDITKRFAFVNDAYKLGHEIGSHANGHFNGSNWTQKQWEQEFEYFNNFIFLEDKNFQKELKNKKAGVIFPKSEITGFRAPLLGHNNAMFKALKNYGFTYETNKVFMQNRMVEKGDKNHNGDIWNFPLYGVNIAGRNTIAMDYNLYYLQTKAKSILKFGTQDWKKAHDNVLKGYLNYFYNHYNNSENLEDVKFKAPVTIGHHFSLWNDALYWVVMKDFAKEVCGKEKVVCGTGQEYEAFLESWGK